MYFAIVRGAIARKFVELTNLFISLADVLASDFLVESMWANYRT
jgi:hypothetical protein